MEFNLQKQFKTGISISLAPAADQSGVLVAVMIGTSDKVPITTTDGTIEAPGIGLTAGKAKEIGYQLLHYAALIENGAVTVNVPAPTIAVH